jgi:hypothetical protein
VSNAHKKPLIIDTRFLRPMPKDLWRSACSQCDKRQSMWELVSPMSPDEVNPVCSLCFLYLSNWSKSRQEDLANMIRDVEAELKKEFTKEDGRLVRAEDGDRILASLAITSRAFQLSDKGSPR